MKTLTISERYFTKIGESFDRNLEQTTNQIDYATISPEESDDL